MSSIKATSNPNAQAKKSENPTGRGNMPNQGGGGFKRDNLKKTPKVRLDNPGGLEFAQDPRVPDAFNVIIGGKTPRYLTIHHPIGRTKLDDKEWVMSDTSDIPLLLSRSKNEFADREKEAYQRKLEVSLTAAGWKHAGKGVFFYPGTDVPRKGRATDQTTASKETLRKLNDLDDAYAATCKAVNEWVAERFNFETKGGQGADKVQRPIPGAKGTSQSGIIDSLYHAISTMLVDRGGIDLDSSPAGQPATTSRGENSPRPSSASPRPAASVSASSSSSDHRIRLTPGPGGVMAMSRPGSQGQN